MLSVKYKYKKIDLASYILIGICNFYLGFTLTKALLYQLKTNQTKNFFQIFQQISIVLIIFLICLNSRKDDQN